MVTINESANSAPASGIPTDFAGYRRRTFDRTVPLGAARSNVRKNSDLKNEMTSLG